MRWLAPDDEHDQYFAGRVEDGVDLGELIQAVEHSESDARELVDSADVRCEMPAAILLSIAQAHAAGSRPTIAELRKLALMLEIDVFDVREFARTIEAVTAGDTERRS